MVKKYIPDRGDLVWLEFDPQSGREQAGHRPAIVLSPSSYNERARLALMCPITSQVKQYPFEVFVEEKKVRGVILADQVRSLDWLERKAKFIAKAPDSVVAEVLSKILLLLGDV